MSLVKFRLLRNPDQALFKVQEDSHQVRQPSPTSCWRYFQVVKEVNTRRRCAALAPSRYDITERRYGEDAWLACACGGQGRETGGGEALGLYAGCSVGGRALMPGTMRGVGECRQRESFEWWGL